MTRDNPPDDRGPAPDWDDVGPYVDRFEDAWQLGGAPAVEDHLPPDGSLRMAVLVELVHVDLEYRLKAGLPASLEGYAGRFPELSDDGDAYPSLRELRERERDLRRRYPPPTPAAVPGYEILGEIDRGGMGVVYKARQVRPNRIVALKMMLSGALAGDAERARFHAETEAIGRLAHPNIVQIFEVGEHEGRAYFSMEYVDGRSLAQATDGRSLPASEAAGLVEALARAVQTAHSRNVIHRDLKPANVLLEGPRDAPPGRCVPKITDFGLAKRLDGESLRTQTGAVLGTPAYMAPEQADGRAGAIGPASDVYSLGVILYELTTGARPFKGDGARIIHQVLHDDPRHPRSINPRLPRDLETITLRCLAKDPTARYRSALALAEDLRRFLDGESVLARRENMASKVFRRARRHPAAASLALIAVLAVVTLGAVLRNSDNDRHLAGLDGQFKTLIGIPDLSDRHLGSIDETIAAIERISPSRAEGRRRSLADWLEGRLDELIRFSPPVSVEDDIRLRPALDRLRQLRPASAERVIAATRRGVIAELAEFDRLAASFGPGDVAVEANGLRPARPFPGGVVPTRLDGRGKLRLDVTFRAGTWGTAERIGLVLHDNRWRTGPIRSLAFGPGGTTLLIADDGESPTSWDLAARSSTSIPGPRPGSASLLFGAAGRADANAPGISALGMRDAGIGEGMPDGRGLRSGGLLTAMAPNGRAVAVGSRDQGRVVLWVREGDRLARRAEFAVPPSSLESLAVSAEGRLVAAGGLGGRITLLDPAATGPPRVLSAHSKTAVTCLAFDREGKALASGGADDMVQLWDPATATCRATLGGHAGRITALAFGPGGLTLASGDAAGKVRRWDASGGAAEADLGGLDARIGGAPIAGLASSPDGRRLAVGHGRKVALWDVPAGRVADELEPGGYVLRLAASRASPAGAPARPGSARRTLGEAVAEGRPVVAQLLRGGAVLREQSIELREGPLALSAILEGDRLALRVNEETSVAYQDAFRLDRAGPGAFSLEWPADARVERLSASSRPPAGAPTPMERGDEAFLAGRPDRALEFYQDLRATVAPREAREARYKEAICLLAQGLRDDASQRLGSLEGEAIGDEGRDRWRTLAAFQLWLLRLRERKFEEADAIYNRLSSSHPREPIAAFLPADVPDQILRARAPESSFTFAVWNPRIVADMHLVLEMAHYLQAPVDKVAEIKDHLATLYHAGDDLDRAEATFADLLNAPGLDPEVEARALEGYAWVLGRRRKFDRALEMLDRRVATGRDAYVPLLIARARVHALGARWESARADLDEYFRRHAPDDLEFLDACLLRGFVMEALGDAERSVASWREGYDAARGTVNMALIPVAIQASLAGALTADDARMMYRTVLDRLPANIPALETIGKSVYNFDEVEAALRAAWATPRGRGWARLIALRDISPREYLSVQVPLNVMQVARFGAFPGALDPEDEELLWTTFDRLYRKYVAGEMGKTHMIQLMTAWNGLLVRISWSQASEKMDDELKAMVAYLLAHRSARQGRKGDARFFFRAAIDSSGPASTLRRRAKAGLGRLGAP